MRKNRVESEHYVLTLKTQTALERYKTALSMAFNEGIALEESNDNGATWTTVTDDYFFPKAIVYRVAK